MAPAATTVKVKKSVMDMIRWMNTEGELTAELRLGAVAKPLAALDESTALEVLNGLLEVEEPIDDPTAWICEAAKAILAEGAPEEEFAEEAPAPALRPAPAVKVRLPGSTVQKIKELNGSGVLQANLQLAEIAESLSLISKEAQDQILQGLQQRAAEVENPLGYVLNACNKKAGKGKGKESKGKGKGKGKDGGKGKGKDAAAPAEQGGKPLTASERKILRHVNFINGSLQLERPLNFRALKEALDLIDEKTQLRILNKVRDKIEAGEEISNPTTWVRRQCQRAYERYEEMRKEKQAQKRQSQQEETWEERKPKKKKAAAAAEEEWAEGVAGGEEDEEEWEE